MEKNVDKKIIVNEDLKTIMQLEAVQDYWRAVGG